MAFGTIFVSPLEPRRESLDDQADDVVEAEAERTDSIEAAEYTLDGRDGTIVFGSISEMVRRECLSKDGDSGDRMYGWGRIMLV